MNDTTATDTKPVKLKHYLSNDQQEALIQQVREAEVDMHNGDIHTRYFLIKSGDVLKNMLATHKAQQDFMKGAYKLVKDSSFGQHVAGMSLSGEAIPNNLRFRLTNTVRDLALVRVKGVRDMVYQLRKDKTSPEGEALLTALTALSKEVAPKTKGKSKSLEKQLGVSFGFPYFARQAASYRVLPLSGVIAVSIPWANVPKAALKAYKKLEKIGVYSSGDLELLTRFKEHKSLIEVRQSKYIEAFEKEQDKREKAHKKSMAKKAKAEKKLLKQANKASKPKADKRTEAAPATMGKPYGKKGAKKSTKKSASVTATAPLI